jgi:hypothetical protein
MALMTGDEKHDPVATLTLDALWVLYDRVLRADPRDPADEDRDRLFTSKGHGPAAYYAALAAKGFIDPGLLTGFGRFSSPLATTATGCCCRAWKSAAAHPGMACRSPPEPRSACAPAACAGRRRPHRVSTRRYRAAGHLR